MDRVVDETAFFRRLPLALEPILRAETVAQLEHATAEGLSHLWACGDVRIRASSPEAVASARSIQEVAGMPQRLRVPLIAHESVVGFLEVQFEREQKGDPLVRRQLHYAATFVALALSSLRSREQLMQVAATDGLTGVASRGRLEHELARLAADRQDFGLLFVDVDGLKRINDELGYEHGDTLIVAIAAAIRGALEGQELVARLGGDEFIVLTPSRALLEQRRQAIEDAVDAIALPAELAARYNGASVGSAVPAASDSPATTLRLAAAEMRREKAARRARRRRSTD